MGIVINLAVNCREFRCLPGPGSLLEQDSLHIYLLNVVQQAWAEKEKKEAERQKQEAESKRAR